MVSFHCFHDGKCEWNKGLKHFAAQFNETYGKEYSLSKCLDISKKGTKHKQGTKQPKQPEVLLEASGDQPMVIECKKIVCPKDYYKNHQRFHDFFNSFKSAFNKDLKHTLPQGFYVLCINESIYQHSQRELDKLAIQIVQHIKDNIDEFLVSDLITIKDPIHCCFRCDCIPESRPDDTLATSGLRLYLEFNLHPLAFNEKRIEAEQIIKTELDGYLDPTGEESIKEKFKEYTNCVKILILELCGNFIFIPDFKTIIEIINNSKIINDSSIPPIVDQIWLAVPEDESEHIIIYHRVV